MTGEGQDELTATLKRYHREIDHLLDLIDQLSPGDRRREELVEKLFVEVMRHQVAEVTFVDPLLRMRLDDGDDIAAAELTQHEHLEASLRGMERLEDGTDAFEAALRDLRAALDEHARHQEQQVLPQLRETIDSADLDDVAARMLPTQQAGATMSHPSKPGEGTLSTGRRVGLTDRVRDAFLVTEGVRVIGGNDE
jgi:hypothetical protein